MTFMCGKRLNSWKTICARMPDLADLLAMVAAAGVERVGVDPEAVDLDRAGGRLLEEVRGSAGACSCPTRTGR